MLDSQMEFQKFRSKGWKLTDPFDPEQVIKDILDWHNKLLELAIAWFTEEHGYPPNLPLRPSCQTGDWTDSAVQLDHVEGDLEIVEEMLKKMEVNAAMRYQWGGVGYLIYGTPWDEIPEWAQEYLKTRFAEGVEV